MRSDEKPSLAPALNPWHICVMWRVLILIVPMTACTQFPELDALIGDDIKGKNTLTTRVAALKARGAALRGDVIDRKTRQRIAQGVKTPDSARNR